MDLERASDRELIEAARGRPGPGGEVYLEALYRRSYPRVAVWCLKFCRDREQAADLAQEVFLRVHSRLETFRMNSSFTTWLYTVVRSVAINRGVARQRHRATFFPSAEAPEPVDPAPDPSHDVERADLLAQVRTAMERDLLPLEAKVLHLHYVNGLTLPAITKLLSLDNKSGAKAFIVSGKRKLKRRFGRPSRGSAALEDS